MKVYGRDINFLRTVEATIKIADMCPDSDIANADKLFDGTYQVSQQTAASFMAILSKGYEDHKSFEDHGYEPNPLTEREALSLSGDEFNELFVEAVSAYAGEKPTVETEPPKGKKKVTESSSTEHGSSSTAEN